MANDTPPLRVSATTATVKQYRDLLRADWAIDTAREAIELLRQIVAGAGYRLVFHWEEPTTRARKSPQPYTIPEHASDHLREFMERLNEQMLPDVPEEIPTRRAVRQLGLQRHAFECAAYLDLQSAFDVDDDDRILRDTQSLLVNLCLHVVLPELRSLRMHDEHDHLLNAVGKHLVVVWRHEPSHCAFLQGMMLDYLGETEAAGDALQAAFRFTGPQEHDYLTKAQAYWSHLIELGDFSSAEAFVIRLVRTVRSDDLAEATELLRQTYRRMYTSCDGARVRRR